MNNHKFISFLQITQDVLRPYILPQKENLSIYLEAKYYINNKIWDRLYTVCRNKNTSSSPQEQWAWSSPWEGLSMLLLSPVWSCQDSGSTHLPGWILHCTSTDRGTTLFRWKFALSLKQKREEHRVSYHIFCCPSTFSNWMRQNVLWKGLDWVYCITRGVRQHYTSSFKFFGPEKYFMLNLLVSKPLSHVPLDLWINQTR